jgi:diguanylate cyclase (GGDEF)-like protein
VNRASSAYLGLVVAATVVAVWLAGLPLPGRGDLASFAVLAVAAGVAQLFVVHAVRNHSFHTTPVFLVAAAMLLPPQLLVLVSLAQHLPEWAKERYRWYLQTFNICNYTLDMLAASAVAGLVDDLAAGMPAGPRHLVTGVAAAAVFVVVNHVLLAVMLRLARGHRVSQTGLLARDSLSIELALAGLGFAVAGFWIVEPWLIPAALSPLVLIHRSFALPALEEEVRIDAKTGLMNSRYFSAQLEHELSRAQRFGRPLSVVMADLDLLRDINNVHGHIAGDAVINGIAEVLREHVRDYDQAARFGGEEFAILLPETTREEAAAIAERIRLAVALRRFSCSTVAEPLSATLSCGVAGFPADGGDVEQLLHRADLALYRAKAQGRNRVVEARAQDGLHAPGDVAGARPARP